MHIVDMIFVGGIIVLLSFCIVALAFCGKYKSNDDDEKRKVAINKRNVWIRSSIIFISLYYWVVLSSIMTTLIVLYISCYEDMGNVIMQIRVFSYSAISVFLSICPYVVNLLGLAKAYRKAFRILDYAIMSSGNLEEAARKGEKIIGGAF